MKEHVAALLVAMSTHAPVAYAEEPASSGGVAEAIELGRDGKAHYDAGRHHEALKAFEAAERLAHSPVFTLYAGRSQRALGRWRDALQSLRRAAAEPLDDAAPAAWRNAVGEAKSEASALAAAIPTLEIVLARPRGDERVLVGTAPYAGGAMPLDPGVYLVVVERDGAKVAEHRVEAKQGRRLVIELSVAPEEEPPPALPALPPRPRALPPSPPSAADEGTSGWRIGGYTLLGIGGAAIATGAVTGGLALATAQDARDACGGDGICPNDDSRRVDAETLAHASTASLVIGGVAVVTGVVLVVVAPEEGAVAAGLGPRGLTLLGCF